MGLAADELTVAGSLQASLPRFACGFSAVTVACVDVLSLVLDPDFL
jgi:hypothetical protein